MGSKLQEYKDTLERSLVDKSKPWTKYFDKAEQKTGVNRVYIFVGECTFFSRLFISLAVGLTLVLLCRFGGVHRFIFSVRFWS